MKNKLSFIVTFWWILLSFVCGVFLLLMADRVPRESQTEKRMLQGFPEVSVQSVFSGDFSVGFESFLSDKFFARDELITAANAVTEAFSAQTAEDRYLLDDTDEEIGLEAVDPGSEAPVVSAGDTHPQAEGHPGLPVSDSEHNTPDDTADEQPDEIAADGIYGFYRCMTAGEEVLEKSANERFLKKIADNLNLCRARLPEDGQVFFTIAPLTRDVMFWLSDRTRYSGMRSNFEDCIRRYTSDGVNVINATETLEPHIAAQEYMYFSRSDPHWTPLAASYICQSMVSAMGVPVVPYDDYTYKSNRFITNKTTGSEFDILNIPYMLLPVSGCKITGRTNELPSKVMDYDGGNYRVYLTGNIAPWSKFVTGFHTGRRALIIGDSFANVLTPYLYPYYDEVHNTDVREVHFDRERLGASIAEMIELHKIDDIFIILSSATAIDTDTATISLQKYLLY